MNIIKVADLHLTDGKADQYKWDFFKWLEKQVVKHRVDRVDILGDLTEKKDQHKSELINKIVDAIVSLSELCAIIITQGNHDYVDQSSPFFGFFKHIPNITYITKPTTIEGELFLPHARNPVEEWGWEELSQNLRRIHTINMHQTIVGSKVPNGFSLEKGMSKNFFKSYKGVVWSGDIHMPQEIGGVEYIGSPYPNYFGDEFQGRVVLIESLGEESDLEYPCLTKWSLRIKDPIDLEEVDFEEGDQAKITIEMHPTYFPDWPQIRKEIKEYCEKEKVQLFGLEMIPEKPKAGRVRRKRATAVKKIKVESPEKVLGRFITQEALDGRHQKAAESLMEVDVL